MLNHGRRRGPPFPGAPTSQNGVVLLIALIVLVALTLAGIALIRSVDTGNLISGNMSFQQSAIQSGEQSTEDAQAWLLDGASDLTHHNANKGFRAVRADPVVNAQTGVSDSWDVFWTATLAAQAKALPKDAAGNTVAYVIHRLCDAEGAPNTSTVHCSKPPPDPETAKHDVGLPGLTTSTQVYYRITTRISGPRHTVAYLQVVVAQ